MAVAHPHKSYTLQFVCGLGPRKASSFIAKISRVGGRIETRSSLIKHRICASGIFMNAASFIRIRKIHFQRRRGEDQVLDVLDDTRIHPENYELARKMAADAIEVEEQLEEDDNPSLFVQELMEGDVSRLDLLLLDDYADELEKSMGEPKRISLNEIKSELKNPYGEKRARFLPASADRIFTMLTGETDETFSVGVVVACRVVRVMDRLVKVALGSGVEGLVHVKNLVDNANMNSTAMEYGIQVNSVLNGLVLDVNKDRISVELSCKPQDLQRARRDDTFRDQFFDQDWENKDIQELEGIHN